MPKLASRLNAFASSLQRRPEAKADPYQLPYQIYRTIADAAASRLEALTDWSTGAIMGSQNGSCPAIPNGGEDKVGLQRNMAAARALARNIGGGANWSVFDGGNKEMTKYMTFADRVRTDGVWDTKNLRDASGKKIFRDGRDYGDFQYGALARAMSFDWPTTAAAAQGYSVLTNGELEAKMREIRNGYIYAAKGCR